MNKKIVFLVLVIFGVLASKAQDPIFSQFHRSTIYLNPAFSGLDGGFTFTAVSREQWGKIKGSSPLPGVYSTQYASIDWTSSSLKNGISAFFMYHEEGDANLRTQLGGINYCYVLPIEHWRGMHNFRLGFGFYYAKKTIDWDKLLFSDQLDPKGEAYFQSASSHAQFHEEFRENPPSWTGLNIGILYRYSERSLSQNGKELSIGLNAAHVLNLTSPTSFESLQSIGTSQHTKFSFHGSSFFPLLRFGLKGNQFTPIFNARFDYQGGISAFTLGGDLLFKNVGLGIYYQNTFAGTILGSTDALIIAFDMEVPFGKNNQSLELGLSYDLNINGLKSHAGGIFELVIKYRKTRDRSRSVICPSVDKAHHERWNNVFYKNQKNKNLN